MMAACSVASRSSHARKDIAASETQEKTAAGKQQESAQPDSTVQDKTPGPVIKEVHHPVKRPASVRDSLSAADSALMAPRPTVSDSLLAIVNIGVATDSTPRPTVSDSLQVQSDTLQTDSTKTEKPLFKDVVEYNAADSIILDVPNKKTFLYKNAFVKYLTTELKADYIELDMENSLAYASGLPDSSGTIVGKPKFKDGSQEFESLDLKYNFKTEKGFVKEIITQQGEGYVQGKLTKKMSDSVYCIKDGWYTTCDKHDHPHFYVRLSKAKMIRDKKVVSGFANLYIEDVPLPLAIPFGFFPITKKGTSGIIMPTYGEERMRGFNLRDGGYYWFINDYVDLTVTGTIYTNGSWGLNVGSNYRKRYKFSGNFDFSMSRNHTSEKGTPDYTQSKDWSIRWQHSQDPKANPYTTFSASVDMSSATNNYYNANNINDIANQRKQSSISWSKKWPDRPFNITASFTHNQNSRDSSISLSFPNLNFRVSQVYPFRRKERAGKLKWYENIGFTYNAELRNSIQTKESELGKSFQNMARDWQNGFKHSIPLSTSINIVKDLSLSPSFTYNGVAYLSSIRKGDWVADSTMPGGGLYPCRYGIWPALRPQLQRKSVSFLQPDDLRYVSILTD